MGGTVALNTEGPEVGSSPLKPLPGSWPALRWLLPLALLHGLLYMTIVPPWQHYDEPTHFEYARLVGIWGYLPAPAEVDPTSSREIAESMYRFRFWQPGIQPDLLSAQPPGLGYDQRVHPPLYYALLALPIGWLRFMGPEAQLYVARFVSLILCMLAVISAWRIALILMPDQPIFHLAIPLLLVVAPAFNDVMSAVNNDVLVSL